MLPLTLAMASYVGLNVYLWTLPIPQTQLFLISVALGIVAIAGFFWLAGRSQR
jgi:nitrogen fixation-related uncharacterized protein